MTNLKNIIDSHFHLLSLQEKGVDVFSMLASLKDSGMSGGIDISVYPEDIEKRVVFKDLLPGLKLSIGLGPWGTAEDRLSVDEEIKNEIILIEKYRKYISFIGEIGLDNHHSSYGEKKVQEQLFIREIELANLYNLPIIIHSREAVGQTADIISSHRVEKGGIFHCFSANEYLLKKALDTGYFISFAGPLTYKNSTSLKAILRYVPLDRLLFETDSPDLPPHPFRGTVNTPDKVVYVYQTASEILNIDFSELVEKVKSNFEMIAPN